MNWYITITSINGRNDYVNLSTMLLECGIEAHYWPGGWDDNRTDYTYPHLRFTSEEDAIIFSLKVGGKIYTNPEWIEITQ